MIKLSVTCDVCGKQGVLNITLMEAEVLSSGPEKANRVIVGLITFPELTWGKVGDSRDGINAAADVCSEKCANEWIEHEKLTRALRNALSTSPTGNRSSV